MYNKRNCVQNIYDIAKEKGIKIGELEKEAGVSTGYLSRIAKEGNTSAISVDLLISISNRLGVSVERLILDTNEMSDSEKYISKFMDKLIQDTKDNSLEWQKQTLAEMRNYEYGDARYPLPFFHQFEGTDYNGNLTLGVDYVTRFYDFGNTIVNAACYWTRFGWDGAVVYITSITHTEEVHSDLPFDTTESTDAFEVYIENKGKLIPLCNTQFLNQDVAQQVKTLYSIITDLQSKLGVTAEVRGLIDNFMQEGLPFN